MIMFVIWVVLDEMFIRLFFNRIMIMVYNTLNYLNLFVNLILINIVIN